MSEYKTLLAQKAELEAQIAQAQAERKAEGIAAARALIAEHGLTAADVFPAAKSKGSAGAPKYRDPATGATWTGRGKPPNWIVGKDRAPFLIE
ncbi:H-NS histone family protein [Delftia acidovorans]|uniref:H-NS histone family protein n=1 Tax=Delftia acidovorans TaxID=80866 RepID=UPI00286F2D59|nr:H-NS histone family protein [Delftia acidovorans]